MGERRQPHKTLLVRKGNQTDRKIEVFCGDEFPGKTFVDALGDPVSESREGTYRLRLDGKWFPARRKMLYDKKQLDRILIQLIGV